MDEDLNDEERERGSNVVVRHVDQTQRTKNNDIQEKEANFVHNTSRVNTFRRYGHTTDGSSQPTDKQQIGKRIDSEHSKTKDLQSAHSEVLKISNTASTTSDISQSKSKDVNARSIANLQNNSILTNPKERKFTVKSENTNIKDVVELQSSDDDDVIEVALPPKPTITIESSDDEELTVLSHTTNQETKTVEKSSKKDSPNSPGTSGNRNREVSASPVPSVVSSVSDDFIKGDCITFNISSRKPEQPSFDFSLHGSDLTIPTTPVPHKKKKKKNKNKTVTPSIANVSLSVTNDGLDLRECFVTPKNKSKNKKDGKFSSSKATPVQSDPNLNKSKSFQQQKKSKPCTESPIAVPNPNIYQTVASHKTLETNKGNENVTNKVMVNESENDVANQHEILVSSQISQTMEQNQTKDKNHISRPKQVESLPEIIDLSDGPFNSSDVIIEDNIIMGNVIGLEKDNISDFVSIDDTVDAKLGSTNVPKILSEKMDFDAKKGLFRFKNMHSLSQHALKLEMEKFYNDSWGGEDFSHKEILKHLPRDKNLWKIDAKDRYPTPSPSKRKIICNYCNRPGHRDDLCRLKAPVCHMCGVKGHREPRCPNKICVNCGAPNYMYSTSCRQCAGWGRVKCCECGQAGHPSSHCPDIWRRYHDTIDTESPLVENRQTKQNNQLFCSGCTRRGHLIHQCRATIPFTGMPINSPYVVNYVPIYPSTPKDRSPIVQEFGRNNENYSATQTSNRNDPINPSTPKDSSPIVKDVERNNENHSAAQTSNRIDPIYPSTSKDRSPIVQEFGRNNENYPAAQTSNRNNKRPSKSPVRHENHQTKKRYFEFIEDSQSVAIYTTKSHQQYRNASKAQSESGSQEPLRSTQTMIDDNTKLNDDTTKKVDEPMPDFIPITSGNHDKKGQMIQDNEVSTSDAVPSARIYITQEVFEKLNQTDGENWLKIMSQKHNMTINLDKEESLLKVDGKTTDQRAFQADLRDWVHNPLKDKPEQSVKPSNPVAERPKPGIEHLSVNNPNEHNPNAQNSKNHIYNIPKGKDSLLQKLNSAIESLKWNLGDPKSIFKELNFAQNKHEQLLNQKVISPKQLSNNRGHINDMLKKLNMILLGQAGMAGGRRHLHELQTLIDRVNTSTNKNISKGLREKIGHHYRFIFTPWPRNDYGELLKSYYVDKSVNNRINTTKPRFQAKKNFKGISNFNNVAKVGLIPQPVKTMIQQPQSNKETRHTIKNNMMLYARQISRAKPADLHMNAARGRLAAQMKSFIHFLDSEKRVSPKMLKKMWTVQDEAARFLTKM